MRIAIGVVVLAVSSAALAQDAAQARMTLWSTSLGVACTYCHVNGAWSDASKPTFEFTQRMSRMVQALNAGPLKEFTPITCWTCHRGQTTPARLAPSAWQSIRDEHVGEFTSPNSSITMSVYAASLGVDCSHCHEPGSFTAPTRPAYGMVTKMLPIFDEIPRYFEKTRMPVTQCYVCHQGSRTPQRAPRE